MQQIIALGGGGFSMEPDNLRLDQYILKQAHVERPKICFLPTASGDAQNYIERFYKAFETLECIPTHLSLFSPPTRDLESFLLEQHIIYVGGGNTKNLLALWREWGVDKALKKALQQGTLLAGISAGAICWFEQGVTDSFGDGLEPIDTLGFLKGSCCPHYDGESNRRESYHQLLKDKKIGSGYGIDDGVAIHFINGEVAHLISSRPLAKAYRVTVDGEEMMNPNFLHK